MKRFTLPILAVLAASVLALAAMSGCGSSNNNNNNGPVGKAEVITANAVIMSTVADITNNDAFAMLNNPAFTGLLNLGGLGIPQLLRSPRDPRASLEAVRGIQARRSSKPNTQLTLPTGTYRVVGDTLVFSSAAPTTYLRLIMANMSVPADSDSITIKDVHYGYLRTGSGLDASTDTIPVGLKIRMYNWHPLQGATPGLIATLEYSLSVTASLQLSSVAVSLDIPAVIYTSVALTLDGVNHVYTLAFDINARRQGVTENLTLRLHTTGDILNDSNVELTGVDFLGSHTYANNSWANNLYITNIYMDPEGAGNDSAHVEGDIRKNNVIVATIAGTLMTPVEPDTCQPVYVTITPTNETVSVCTVYGELAIPGVTLSPRRMMATDTRRWYQ
ncbi:MAG: hypothetical protein HZB25_07010 [Candidatus Eisenbacteria bacterium]|nr:hypothetical protein [Candidatus Eisenbacteria bacterium]